MVDGIERVLEAIPKSDQYCNLKRSEVRRWLRSCRVPRGKGFVDFAVTVLQEGQLWEGYKLNRLAFGQRLLNDPLYLEPDYNKYQLACLLCSGERVREYLLGRAQQLNRSIEDLVTLPLGRLAHTKLERFWSHYANIVDVADPSPVIIDGFEKMMSAKGLSPDSQTDIWKYGFMCAKEEGSIDALGFFSDKLLQGKYEQRDDFLIDTLSNINFHNDRGDAASRTIEFCIVNLNYDKYEDLVKEMVRINRFLSILSTLIRVHLYDYAKKLIKCIDPKEISSREYSNLLSAIGHPVFPTPEESKGFRIDMFIWLWGLKKFNEHRRTYLNNLDDTSAVTMLIKFVEMEELDLFKLILCSAKPQQVKKAMIYSGNGRFLCRALYQRGERLLLLEALDCIRNGGEFLSNLDEIVYNHLKCILKKRNNISSDKVFDLYIKGKRGELLQYVEPIVQTRDGYNQLLHDVDILVLRSFSDMIEGRFEFKEIGNGISSFLDDIKQSSCSNPITKNGRK